LDENLCKVKNLWDQIDDFKWLKAETNPHWSVLPESNRLDETFWGKAMMNEDLKAADVIQAAKLTL
jgi:tubulin-specific chaperone C